ncbi:hypothetical protein [uncultured Muribaculum sp.]|jgi:hypothetical protein|uniref:hypothetical protein n=1 Tax=uncultured Muribaculum sp. TaxID=1918613 RepID=UPI002731EFA4|nr:hypothetical protein [uncultured Muribaculum sp.]
MDIEKFKWYNASEILPEQASIEKGINGVVGWFLIVMYNGDLACANRWLEGTSWYWDTDNEYNDRIIEQHGISHWMLVELPQN